MDAATEEVVWRVKALTRYDWDLQSDEDLVSPFFRYEDK